MRLKKTIEPKKGGIVYFMSDLHYNHANILKLGKNRPFTDVNEMNSYIIKTLSETLTEKDIVFDLGDLGWKINPSDLSIILDSCNGAMIYKIMGNHDNQEFYRSNQSKFSILADILDVSIKSGEEDPYRVSLCHYPIEDFNHMYHGGLHLFGHVHGGFDREVEIGRKILRADVGFDGNLAREYGSFLIPFTFIIDKFKERTGGLDFRQWAKESYGEQV